MTLYIQDFVMAIIELLIKVLKLIKPVGRTIVPHITTEARWDLIRSIKPLIDWILSILPFGVDSFLSMFENETVSGAFIGVLNSTSDVDSHGLTHIINGTASVLSNESSYNYVGSQFVYTLFEFLAWIIGLIANFMYDLPNILPWA